MQPELTLNQRVWQQENTVKSYNYESQYCDMSCYQNASLDDAVIVASIEKSHTAISLNIKVGLMLTKPYRNKAHNSQRN